MLKDKCGKTTNIIGHDGESKKQIKVLNRFISVKDSGNTYEPDVRHSEMLVNELGLQGEKTLSTPVSDMQNETEELLDHEKFKKYQSMCARVNFSIACDSQGVVDHTARQGPGLSKHVHARHLWLHTG